MKKIMSIAISGLLAFSCANSPVDMETGVKPDDQAEIVSKGVKADIVLYGTVSDDVETKLAASEEVGCLKFNFEENDALSTFFVSGEKKDVNVKFTYDKNSKKFVPDEGRLYTALDGDMPNVYGIYPYEKGMSSVTDLTKVPVTIPQVQMYDPEQYTSNPKFPKNYCRFAAVPSTLVKEDDGSYSIGTAFYSMGSMIKFQVQNSTGEPLSIRSVNIYGAPGLSGDFTADLTADPSFSNNDYKLTPVNGGNQYNHVCVSFGNAGFSLPKEKRMPVYAFVNAAVFEGDGFSMTVSTDKGTYQADFTERKEGVDGFARNARHTYTVTLNSGRLIGSEYVARYSNDGGKTWTNATSLKLAISNIKTEQSKDLGIVELLQDAVHGNNAALVCNGKKFTINGNGYSYDISNRTGHAFSIGGTNESDVTFRDIKIFSNETNDSPSSCYLAYNITSNSRIAFAEGTEINGIYYKGTNGGVVYNKGTLDINGAKISNCGVKKTSEDKGGSGGFVFSTGVGAVVNFYGGEIINCSAETNGGAICNYTSSTVNINGGEISNCSAGSYGGAIYNYSGVLNMDGGNISDCSASSGSAILATGGEVNVSGGGISSSSGTTGAIFGNSYTTKITIGRENDPSSCPVINNTTGKGVYSYGITKIYGGIFKTYGVSAHSLSGKNGDASLEISGGDFESTNTNTIYAAKSDDYNSHTAILGGRFKCHSSVAVVNGTADVQVCGGYFSKEVKSDYLAEGYGCLKTDRYPEYPYEVLVPVTFQQVGGEVQNMASLEDAVTAANEAVGECTITLCADATISNYAKFENKDNVINLDLAGHKISCGKYYVHVDGAKVIITDSSKDKSGEINATNLYAIYNSSGGNLTVESGNIINTNKKAIWSNGSTCVTTINGGTVTATDSAAVAIYAGQCTISGGTIESANGKTPDNANNTGWYIGTVSARGGGAKVTITDGTIKNTKGIAVYGLGTSAKKVEVKVSGGSLESWTYTLYPYFYTKFTVTGGNLSATASEGNSSYCIYANTANTYTEATVEGGFFKGNTGAVKAISESVITLKGGSYNMDPTKNYSGADTKANIPDGYKVVDNGAGETYRYSVKAN